MAKILSYPGDFRAFKGLIAAKYAGVAVETDLSFEMGKSDKTAEFLKLSPMGKVPVLQCPEGVLLQSNAIARYFARQAPALNLMGASFFDQAKVDSWLDWISSELEVPVTMWIFPILGFMPPNPKNVANAKKNTKVALKMLEAHLMSRSYMVGEAITLVDIVLASALVYPFKMVFDFNFRKQYPSVCRWFMTVTALPQFAHVLGDVVMCSKAMELPKPVKKAKKGKKKGGNKGGGEQKQGDKPKKKKKSSRKKHPLEDFEKSNWVLDDFKRAYSNTRTLEALYTLFDEDFAKNFDDKPASGFSIWLAVKDKNPDATVPENVKDDGWKVGNTLRGLVERFEEVRKWSFGIYHVYADFDLQNRWQTEGIHIIRGQSCEPLKCNPEYELFSWRKLEINKSEADKTIARNFICSWDNCGEIAIKDTEVFK